MRFVFLFFGLISATCLPAQQTSLSGPVEGFTFDAPTRSLRAVIGFPGAASFGPALLDGLEFASVAPGQTYGVVFENGKFALISGLGSKTISTLAIPDVAAHPDGIVWSANGSHAILYSLSGNWFQTIAGFPNAPAAGAVVDLSSLGASFSALATDPPGTQIVVGVSGDNGAVYLVVNGQFTRLASIAKPASLTFSSDGRTVFALDAYPAQVTAVDLNGNGFQTLPLAGVTNPVAIQAVEDSQNRQLLYVAGGSDRMLRILDVASLQIVSDVPLNFQPTCLHPFGSGSFVLASRAQAANPLWLFASSPQPGAYFVPAVQLLRPEVRVTASGGRTR
jgi:WD40 repeat protein